MARYDVQRHWFRTPNGKPVLVYVREGTNDWNTANATLGDNDEYGLRGRRIDGLALDVGGYLGTVAIAILIDSPTARVVCVEPVPENADLIRRNATANGVADRLDLREGAVGWPGSEVTTRYAFQGGENELHHAFVGNSTLVAPEVAHSTARGQALTLDDLAGEEQVAFLKIDCEGGEWPFLESSDLARLPCVTGEWHPASPDGSTGSQARLLALMGPTHVVAFTGPEAGPGGFTAVRR